jgi:hypothetical protein
MINKEEFYTKSNSERMDIMIDMAIELGIASISESCGSGCGVILVTGPEIMKKFVDKIQALNRFPSHIKNEENTVYCFTDGCNENFGITTSEEEFDSWRSVSEFQLSFRLYE